MLYGSVIPDGQDSADSSAPAIAAIALVILLIAVEVAVYFILALRISV